MDPKRDILDIFRAGVAAVDPERLMHDAVRRQGEILEIRNGSAFRRIDLRTFDAVCVLGIGKASARMALALEGILEERITDGLVVTKYGHGENLSHIRLQFAGHPVPDAGSMDAAREMIRFCDTFTEKTLVLTLVSGGGSSLLCAPADDGVPVSLEDKQETTRQLLGCGAEIQEINCLRKHLSALKGGRLQERIHPATSIGFILSDVVGDALEDIASGITAPDPTTFADAAAIIGKYGLSKTLPESVLRRMEAGCRGRIPETPKADSPVFASVRNLLIGTNRVALEAAGRKAAFLGYHPLILSSCITGEAREVAKVHYGISRDLIVHDEPIRRPACILSGGETTVTLDGQGRGGRNQEMAVAFLAEMAEKGAPATVHFLSGATDGNDGPTDAAGGLANLDVLETAGMVPQSLRDALSGHDAYPFLEACGGLVKTGPTNTNVCDIQVLLVTDDDPVRPLSM